LPRNLVSDGLIINNPSIAPLGVLDTNAERESARSNIWGSSRDGNRTFILSMQAAACKFGKHYAPDASAINLPVAVKSAFTCVARVAVKTQGLTGSSVPFSAFSVDLG